MLLLLLLKLLLDFEKSKKNVLKIARCLKLVSLSFTNESVEMLAMNA